MVFIVMIHQMERGRIKEILKDRPIRGK